MRSHVNIPISAIGALNEPQMLDDIIGSGQADAVVMARALLADPFLPRKAYEGRDDEIVRCCRCFACMAERLTTGLRICALNPVIGHEYEHKFTPPPTKPKKVLIAGGGPSGMQCAITAAERGHEVTLCEKTAELGGALKAERGISFKEDLYKFIEVKALEMEKAGVEVKLNTEVTPELANSVAPDVLIVAVGSEPLVPPIPGIEKAVMADDLPGIGAKLGQRVVVIGGGLVGCETALHLAMEGRDVTVVEMKDDVCTDANPRHRPLLLAELGRHVVCLVGTRAAKVTGEGIICETKDGEVLVPADAIVCAAGRVPNRAARGALADCAPYIDAIGDCIRPANVAQAVFRGYFAALDI
jgi:NADPH-dependent 2,4-dienoyl-CoA reductase/sulfur reductase-like enzyme